MVERVQNRLHAMSLEKLHGTVHPTPIELTRTMLDAMPRYGVAELLDPGIVQEIQVMRPTCEVTSRTKNVFRGSVNFRAFKCTEVRVGREVGHFLEIKSQCEMIKPLTGMLSVEIKQLAVVVWMVLE